MRICILWIIVVASFAACNDSSREFEIIETGTRPDFIDSITTWTTYEMQSPTDEAVCIGLNMLELWEIGDVADELNQHILENARATFNGETVPLDYRGGVFANFAPVYGENGEFLGSYGNVTLCYTLDDLDKGTYEVVLQIPTTSGEQHRYQWELVIK